MRTMVASRAALWLGKSTPVQTQLEAFLPATNELATGLPSLFWVRIVLVWAPMQLPK